MTSHNYLKKWGPEANICLSRHLGEVFKGDSHQTEFLGNLNLKLERYSRFHSKWVNGKIKAQQHFGVRTLN